MSTFRFIHCSDLHIDSPFKGFSTIDPEWARRLREASMGSFLGMVDLAVREQVDAVVIAGDVFDGADRSLQAQFKFRAGLQTLSDHGIPSFIAHGNHDPLSTWSTTLKWPDRVTVFPGDKVRTVPVVREGRTLAHISGISFPRRDVYDNLAMSFARKPGPGFRIGVLHANVGGNPNHDPYAPCSLNDLVTQGMDYWALGHVHAHEILRGNNPAVVYCGNSQGRHFRESGPRGCCLVTMNEHSLPDIQFIATDHIRFAEMEVGVSDCATLDALVGEIVHCCQDQLKACEGRDLVLRVTLTGRTEIDVLLRKAGSLESLREETLRILSDAASSLWLEFRCQTRGMFDIDALKQGKDFIAELISLYENQLSPEGLQDCREALRPLFEIWEGGTALSEFSEDELRNILLQAQNLTLDALTGRD